MNPDQFNEMVIIIIIVKRIQFFELFKFETMFFNEK